MNIIFFYPWFVLLLHSGALQGNWCLYVSGENSTEIRSYTVAPKQHSAISLAKTFPTTTVSSSLLVSREGTHVYLISKKKECVTPLTLSSAVAQEGPSVPLGVKPSCMAISPVGKELFVVSSTEGLLKRIDFSTLIPSVGEPIAVGVNPQAIAISPMGRRAFVCNYGKPSENFFGSLSCIDLISSTVSFSLSLAPYNPFAMAMDSEGVKGYIMASVGADERERVLLPVDLSGAVPVIGSPVSVPCSLFSKIVLTPDGKRIFSMNKDTQSVILIENVREAPVVLPPIYVVHVPYDLVVTPDSSTLFVSYADWSTILPIDISGGRCKFGEMIFVDGSLSLMAISPDESPQAMFTIQAAPAGEKTMFSAVESKTNTGTIVRYEWDFGDGTFQVTKRDTISHIYRKSALYRVTLTVTNSSGTSTDQCYTGQSVARDGGKLASLTKEVFVRPHKSSFHRRKTF